MGITKKGAHSQPAQRHISGGFLFFFSMRTSAAALKHKYINVAPRGLCFLLLTGVLKAVCYELRMCVCGACVRVCVCVYKICGENTTALSADEEIQTSAHRQ